MWNRGQGGGAWLYTAAAYFGIALVARAAAQDDDNPHYALSWTRLPGAEDCLTALEVARHVEARLDHVWLFVSASEANRLVEGYVRRAPSGAGWDIGVQLSDASGSVKGRRRLHFSSSNCRDVDDYVTLEVSELVRPTPQAPAPAPSSEPELDPEPPDRPPTQVAPHAEPTRPASAPAPTPRAERGAAPFGSALDIAGVAGLGQLPALAGGLAGHIRIAVNGLWPIELGLVRFASQSALASPSSNSADFDLWSGSAAACPWDASLHALSLCGGAEVARLHVEPHFAVRNRARTDVIASVFASLALRIELVGRLHLRSAVVLGAPLPARSYSYEQGSIGHQLRLLSMWPVNARLELGLGLRL